MIAAKRILIALVCLLPMFAGQAFAAGVTVKGADVVMDVPEAWMSKVQEKKIRQGVLMQSWIRERVMIQDGKRGARPAIVAITFPVSPETNLALFTRVEMQRRYNINLANMDCLKCVRYNINAKGRTMGMVSFEPPPEEMYSGPDAVSSGPREVNEINDVGLTLEPSWVFRGEKHSQGILMDLIVVHAKLNGKILEVSFVYPNESREELQPEIYPIIHSIRKK